MIVNGLKLLVAAPIKYMLRQKVRHNGVSHGLSEAGYDIRILQEVRFWKRFWFIPMVTVTNPEGVATTSFGTRFTLASASEKFDMPDNLVGVVHDKSTWARKGLSVFNTVIEPGWRGFLTLELVYHGKGELWIKPDSGIAQVLFSEIQLPVSYGDGKYQNQPNRPVAAIQA